MSAPRKGGAGRQRDPTRTVATVSRAAHGDAPARRRLVVGLAEGALVVIGVAFIVVPSDQWVELAVLFAWDVLAGAYVAVGTLVVWRPWRGVAPDRGMTDAPDTRYWSGMIFTVAASVIGMTAAGVVIVQNQDGTTGSLLTLLAVAAMILAWTLVHVGFARLYAAAYHRPEPDGGGLQFPHSSAPAQVEFLYFAFTVGVTFAVSDVSVTQSEMRWRVLVHSVVSFFYSAAVIALAISTLTDL
jgi:uncharacterized membrane protein